MRCLLPQQFHPVLLILGSIIDYLMRETGPKILPVLHVASALYHVLYNSIIELLVLLMLSLPTAVPVPLLLPYILQVYVKGIIVIDFNNGNFDSTYSGINCFFI